MCYITSFQCPPDAMRHYLAGNSNNHPYVGTYELKKSAERRVVGMQQTVMSACPSLQLGVSCNIEASHKRTHSTQHSV